MIKRKLFFLLVLVVFLSFVQGQDYYQTSGSTQNVVEVVSMDIVDPSEIEYDVSSGFLERMKSGYNLVVKDSDGNLVANSSSKDFELLGSKGELFFRDRGGGISGENVVFFIQGKTIEVSDTLLNSEFTYNPSERSLSIGDDSTATIDVGIIQLRNIGNATIKVNEAGELNYADFVSRTGGPYVFHYNGLEYSISANKGDRIIFDPKNNRLIGNSISGREIGLELNEGKFDNRGIRFSERQGFVNAKDFEITLDENGRVLQVDLPNGGTYQDRENNLDYSSREKFSVFYDGREIKDYEGNAISVLDDSERGLSVRAKGLVNVNDLEKKIFYEGKNSRVYTEYDLDNSYFDVQAGEASINNGKHKVDIKDGLAMNLGNLEYSGPEVFPFAVNYSFDGTEREHLLINYRESNGKMQAESIYFQDGKETIVDLGSLSEEEARWQRQRISEESIKYRIREQINSLDFQIEQAKLRGGDYSNLIKERDLLELGEVQIKLSKLLESGDYDSAISELKRYVKQPGRDEDSIGAAKLGMAELYLAVGSRQLAINTLKDAISNNPSVALDARFAMAGVELASGFSDEAIKVYRSIISDNSLAEEIRSRAFLGMASSYSQKGEYQHSLTAFDQAIKLNPNDVDAITQKRNLELRIIDVIRTSISGERVQISKDVEEFLSPRFFTRGAASAAMEVGRGSLEIVNFFAGTSFDTGSYSKYATDIVNSARDQLTSQDVGLMMIEGLYKQGYSFKDIESMTPSQLIEIYNLPVDSSEASISGAARESAVTMRRNIAIAFQNPDIQNLISERRQPFQFGSYSEEMPDLRDRGPNIIDAALFVPFATTGGVGYFSTAGGKMLISRAGVLGMPAYGGLAGAIRAEEGERIEGAITGTLIGTGIAGVGAAMPLFSQTVAGQYLARETPTFQKIGLWLNKDVQVAGKDIVEGLRTQSLLKGVESGISGTKLKTVYAQGGKINGLSFSTDGNLESGVAELKRLGFQEIASDKLAARGASYMFADKQGQMVLATVRPIEGHIISESVVANRLLSSPVVKSAINQHTTLQTISKLENSLPVDGDYLIHKTYSSYIPSILGSGGLQPSAITRVSGALYDPYLDGVIANVRPDLAREGYSRASVIYASDARGGLADAGSHGWVEPDVTLKILAPKNAIVVEQEYIADIAGEIYKEVFDALSPEMASKYLSNPSSVQLSPELNTKIQEAVRLKAEAYWKSAVPLEEFKKSFVLDAHGSYVSSDGRSFHTPEILIKDQVPLQNIEIVKYPSDIDTILRQTGAKTAGEALSGLSSTPKIQFQQPDVYEGGRFLLEQPTIRSTQVVGLPLSSQRVFEIPPTSVEQYLSENFGLRSGTLRTDLAHASFTESIDKIGSMSRAEYDAKIGGLINTLGVDDSVARSISLKRQAFENTPVTFLPREEHQLRGVAKISGANIQEDVRLVGSQLESIVKETGSEQIIMFLRDVDALGAGVSKNPNLPPVKFVKWTRDTFGGDPTPTRQTLYGEMTKVMEQAKVEALKFPEGEAQKNAFERVAKDGMKKIIQEHPQQFEKIWREETLPYIGNQKNPLATDIGPKGTLQYAFSALYEIKNPGAQAFAVPLYTRSGFGATSFRGLPKYTLPQETFGSQNKYNAFFYRHNLDTVPRVLFSSGEDRIIIHVDVQNPEEAIYALDRIWHATHAYFIIVFLQF
jgi:tetratricopeptide (TPR) repeat protein